MISPLKGILSEYGCKIDILDGNIIINSHGRQKHLIVYPAMWIEPHMSDAVFVSDAYVKYAKPYAVRKILEDLGITQ